jgi:hypothetical protein
MTLAVHTGNHENVVLEDSIVEAIRELRQENTTRVLMDERVRLRMRLDRRHGHIESTTELFAQAAAAPRTT